MVLELRMEGKGYRFYVRKTADVGNEAGVSLNRGLKRPLCEAVKLRSEMPWMSNILEMAELWDTCRGKLQTRSGVIQRGRSVLQSTN